LTVHLGLLPLLVGKTGFSVSIEDPSQGSLDFAGRVGLFSLIAKQRIGSAVVSLEAEKFAIGAVVNFATKMLAEKMLSQSSNTNALLFAPELKKMALQGQLTAAAKFSVDFDDVSNSEGSAAFEMANAVLTPGLNLPDQRFSKAMIKARLDAGVATLDPSSGFTAPELDLGLNGKVSLKTPFNSSTLDFTLIVKLDKDLKDQFSFLISGYSASGSDNQLRVQFNGPISSPSTTTL